MTTDRVRMGAFQLAIEALLLLATAPDGQLSSRALAAQIGSHDVTVRRLLSRLRYAGLVEGREGRHGGWALARDPMKLRIGDVHRALRADGPAPRRPLETLLREADHAFADRLDCFTVAGLAAQEPAGGRL